MLLLRLSKILLVAAIAFTVSLVAFGNLTDYGTNWAFVTHVLSMDTIFPDSAIRYRAVTDHGLQVAAYWLIIAAETATALILWAGAVVLAGRLSGTSAEFTRAKAPAIAGLTLGFLTWQVGFMAIGGEWFGMWQSTV